MSGFTYYPHDESSDAGIPNGVHKGQKYFSYGGKDGSNASRITVEKGVITKGTFIEDITNLDELKRKLKFMKMNHYLKKKLIKMHQIKVKKILCIEVWHRKLKNNIITKKIYCFILSVFISLF